MFFRNCLSFFGLNLMSICRNFSNFSEHGKRYDTLTYEEMFGYPIFACLTCKPNFLTCNYIEERMLLSNLTRKAN